MFSIIIASKDRAEKLPRCLESINQSDMIKTGSELIIVDNGSKDNSLEIIKKFQADSPFDVKIFIEKKKGNSFCCNKGIKNSKGSIIIFTDDDCYFSKNYLQIAQNIFKNEAIAFASGRVLLYDKNDCSIMTCTNTKPKIIDVRSLAGLPKIIGANMIIRKSVIKNTGPFDIMFGPGSEFAGNDIDYISRVLIKGYKGVYDPTLVVYHHHGRKETKVILNQERYYAKGIGAQYCKRILNRDASALNALLFAISKANNFSLFKLSQEEYKEEMLQGARQYLKLFLKSQKNINQET